MTARHVRAAVLHGLGQVPRYGVLPEPVAGEGEAVVTVTAAALKPSDRAMAEGVHYAPAAFPCGVGLDGVGRLDDGTRVAFFLPQQPYGGMAERTLVRRDVWLPVPDGVDDAIAAALLNPGMAAWKAVVAEGEVAAGQTVLVLGATGASGRVAAQLAVRRGARVVGAGRDQDVLDGLVANGVHAAISVDRPHEEVVGALVAEGPYDLVVDYLWGGAAEAAFAALARTGEAARPVRYILVGMSAGDVAGLPAMTLRKAPVQMVGSGFGGRASLDDAAAAFAGLLRQVAAGDLVMDVETVPLADVEEAWTRKASGRRIVLVP
ncbi:quinone oxidoreductase family protein [Actinomadura fibrosa]|uniref:Zinc-binding alcohol dehydrogenase family protein n=1 Tax=Actinomadura fibrosa TaxID=111802 RepID=A0ABW2XSM4_9ACTN|nr:zinc-binding alcohol dehydrogenase family protein [Actinomadura fibrosa]